MPAILTHFFAFAGGILFALILSWRDNVEIVELSDDETHRVRELVKSL